MAAHSEGRSCWWSRTRRTARGRTSGEYFFDVFMTPSSQSLESPAIPGRFMEARYPNLGEAVRWPDDPTRQIGLGPIFKFGYNMLSECRANSADGIDVN